MSAHAYGFVVRCDLFPEKFKAYYFITDPRAPFGFCSGGVTPEEVMDELTDTIGDIVWLNRWLCWHIMKKHRGFAFFDKE